VASSTERASAASAAAGPTAAGPTAERAGVRSGEPGYRRIAVALFAAGVATFALLYSTQALLPELARSFSVSATQSTLSLSLATVGLGVALLVAGPASEVLGRTRLIRLSLLASAVVAVACAAAPGWDWLLILRLAQGVALAGLPAAATAYLREELHPDTYARAAGLYIGGTALGGMAGRLLTGAVAGAAGWRWALAAVALLGLVCAGVVALTLPPSRNFSPAPARPRQLAVMTRRALSDPGLLALYAIGACSMGAFVAVYNAMGFRLTSAPLRLSVGAAGLVFLVYPVGTVSSAVAGRMAERFSRRAVVPVGCLITAAGVLLTLPGSLPLIVAGLAVMTAGFFVVHGVASGWVPARAHAGGVASAQAASLYLFAYYLGSSVFGNLGGRAWTVGGWPAVAALALALLVISGLLAAWLRRTPALGREPLSGTDAGHRLPRSPGIRHCRRL
jgi:YNFM family putative membrane transporter